MEAATTVLRFTRPPRRLTTRAVAVITRLHATTSQHRVITNRPPVTIRRRVITMRNRATTSPRTLAGKGMIEAGGTATIAAIGTMTAVVMMGEVTTEVDVTVAMAAVKQLQKSGASSAAFFCPD